MLLTSDSACLLMVTCLYSGARRRQTRRGCQEPESIGDWDFALGIASKVHGHTSVSSYQGRQLNYRGSYRRKWIRFNSSVSSIRALRSVASRARKKRQSEMCAPRVADYNEATPGAVENIVCSMQGCWFTHRTHSLASVFWL